MYVVCSDLEGVFVPEVWINVAEKTGIEILRRTTRDEPDYDKLMQWRIGILEEKGLTLKDIQDVIAQIEPLDGANEMIDWIKKRSQLIVVSDTFAQFADPLMAQLNRPTLFCHQLVIDDRGMIMDYKLRQKDPKKKVVEALQGLQYKVIAFGDSYNDTTMLLQADVGILFRPPQNVIDDFSQLPVVNNYEELREILAKYI